MHIQYIAYLKLPVYLNLGLPLGRQDAFSVKKQHHAEGLC